MVSLLVSFKILSDKSNRFFPSEGVTVQSKNLQVRPLFFKGYNCFVLRVCANNPNQPSQSTTWSVLHGIQPKSSLLRRPERVI